jgi:hypothetical protein
VNFGSPMRPDSMVCLKISMEMASQIPAESEKHPSPTWHTQRSSAVRDLAFPNPKAGPPAWSCSVNYGEPEYATTSQGRGKTPLDPCRLTVSGRDLLCELSSLMLCVCRVGLYAFLTSSVVPSSSSSFGKGKIKNLAE